MRKLKLADKHPLVEFEELKRNLSLLRNKIDHLDAMAGDYNIKDRLWIDGEGEEAIYDIEWLYNLQNSICDITGDKPVLDSAFISSLDSMNERVQKIKDYSERLLSFIQKHISDCDEPLRDYDYEHAWESFDDCKAALKKRLSVLVKILDVDDGRKQASVECDRLWKEFMKEVEHLNKFANYYLRGYDDDDPINFNMSRAYNGKKKAYEFVDDMFERLERSRDSFEKNLDDNLDYMRFDEVNPYRL